MDSVGSGLGTSKLLLNPQEEICSVITTITNVLFTPTHALFHTTKYQFFNLY